MRNWMDLNDDGEIDNAERCLRQNFYVPVEKSV